MTKEAQGEWKSEPESGSRSGLFYPFLFALAPVLSVFSSNLSVFPLTDLIRPILMVLVGMGLCLATLTLALRSQQRASAATLPLLGAWWLFSPAVVLTKGLGNIGSVGVIFVLTVLAVWLMVKWNPDPRFLNAASLILTLILIGGAAVRLALPPKSVGLPERSAKALPAGPRPDIFFIVPDGFGRLDVLKEKHGIDLAWFEQALKERGFQTPKRSRSTYLQTQLSLSSTLNLNYLSELAQEMGTRAEDRRMFGPLITHSLAAKTLVDSGYRHITIGSGFEGIQLGGEVQDLHAKRSVSLFEASLLKKTPISLLPWLDEVQAEAHRGQLLGAFGALKALSRPGPKPNFVVAHLLAPHPPFVFDEKGNPLPPKGGFAISDGEDYMKLVSGPDDYRQGYGRKVQFTAYKLLELIDALLKDAKSRPPVIIIQGDHGSKLGVSHESLEKTDPGEGFSNFYSVYSPPDVPLKLPDLDSNVNTFRRLFTALGAKNLEPLEPRSWYSTTQRPLDFTEVTNRVP